MAMSAAAIEGIKANGHGWKHTIRLGTAPKELGVLNDRRAEGGEVSDAEVEERVLRIVKAVRAYLGRHPWAKDTDLAERADDLEAMADCGLDEVNYAMGELYDSFDFNRILVGRP